MLFKSISRVGNWKTDRELNPPKSHVFILGTLSAMVWRGKSPAEKPAIPEACGEATEGQPTASRWGL